MMNFMVTALRYCGQALAFALFGKAVGTAADHVMKEAPDLIGMGRFHVKFVMPDGTEKEARFPFRWMALLYVKLQYKRHYHNRQTQTVYKTKHATVTC